MGPSVQRYFEQGLASSTRRSYQAASKRFSEFCSRFSITTPFPVTEQVLCCFAAYLADVGLKPGTVKVYLAAVRNLQLSLGLPDPRDQSSLPFLKRVLMGISRAQMPRSAQNRPRLPITGPLLVRIHSILKQSSNPEKICIWAICSLAFFGFFRLGELLLESPDHYDPAIHLSWGDMAVDSTIVPTMIKVYLKRSKCDQFGEGVDVVVGHTNSPICPVTAVLDYIRQRQDTPGAFFLDSNQRPVRKVWFIQQVRQLIQSLGLPDHHYAGHSFRIGAATSAALAGVEDSTIQALGRWQSAAFLQYIRLPQDHLALISQQLSTAALNSPAPHPPPDEPPF